MKHIVSIILALCFVSSMTSCSRKDDFEIEEFSSSSVSAVTELDSSSISAVTELDSSSELDFAASSSSAAEAIAEKTKTSTTTTVKTETNSTEETTSKNSELTTKIDETGQIIETTIETTVTKPIETTSETQATSINSTTTQEYVAVNAGIDDYSYQLLAEIVEHEAGMDSISIYDKAHIASAVMNRVNDGRFPNTVYDNLIDQSQFPGYYPGCIIPRQTAYAAVDYYFAHPNEFDNSNSWYGDSWTNYFYYQ